MPAAAMIVFDAAMLAASLAQHVQCRLPSQATLCMRLPFLPAQPLNASDTAVARCQGMLAAAMIVLDAARLAALLAQHVQYRQKPTSRLVLTPYRATALGLVMC